MITKDNKLAKQRNELLVEVLINRTEISHVHEILPISAINSSQKTLSQIPLGQITKGLILLHDLVLFPT